MNAYFFFQICRGDDTYRLIVRIGGLKADHHAMVRFFSFRGG